MNHAQMIAQQLTLRPEQSAAAIELFDAGNTIPFVARYRKEVTGGLDEEQLRSIVELLAKLRALDERRVTVLNSIAEQGKLTAELEKQIQAADSLTALEDLYQPYKPKRRTRAMIARERGLQPLADLIVQQKPGAADLAGLAQPFLSEAVPADVDAWAGASDIVAEQISDHADVRRLTREKAGKNGVLLVEKIEQAEDARQVYSLYYTFECRVDRLRPYQVLAINRGEAEKVLRVKLQVAESDWRASIQAIFRPNPASAFAALLQAASDDAAERLLLPAIERDIRRELSEKADAHAIAIFAANLRALLSQPPLAGQVVLGMDPGYRTGCKLAVVDPTGKLLAVDTIYLHDSEKHHQQALKTLRGLVERHQVTLFAIGNGTASRETEQLAAELIRLMAEGGYRLHYLIVSEAGASVYSASRMARSELPDLDVSLRGAVSIARRIQDPLAELVKIEPKAIGVGLYQHDVDQGQLAGALSDVVESVVNRVGVEVNTASPALLTYVSGIGPKLAENIVAHRESHGKFERREDLKAVPKLGPKAFEQAAGFLRIRDGAEPLDASAIHPESYGAARQLLEKARLAPDSTLAARKAALDQLLSRQRIQAIASELNTGVPTLTDIVEQLIRPGRDPRQELPRPILRSDVLQMEDLVVGMQLKGTVRNVVDFGAFIDVGVKQDGLLHRSQTPRELSLKVGDIIEVEILKVEPERGRISLKYVIQK
jgi:protein Tex